MSRLGYQVLGFAVWTGAKWYLRGRLSETPRKVAMGGVAVALLAALLLGARRATNG